MCAGRPAWSATGEGNDADRVATSPEWGAVMTIGMTKVLHVKIPVSDLQRSVTWYCELLDLEVFQGVRGAGHPAGSRAAQPGRRVRGRSQGAGVLRGPADDLAEL